MQQKWHDGYGSMVLHHKRRREGRGNNPVAGIIVCGAGQCAGVLCGGLCVQPGGAPVRTAAAALKGKRSKMQLGFSCIL